MDHRDPAIEKRWLTIRGPIQQVFCLVPVRCDPENNDQLNMVHESAARERVRFILEKLNGT